MSVCVCVCVRAPTCVYALCDRFLSDMWVTRHCLLPHGHAAILDENKALVQQYRPS